MTADLRAAVLADLDVSRETTERLDALVTLLNKWNPAINLVARSTLADVWTRHIADSAQVFDVADRHSGLWLDLGSGGGFPGLVVAILAREKAPDLAVTCIEADLRKASFLRTAAQQLGLAVGVLSRRIEDTPPQNAAVVSARAVAALDTLLGHAARHLAPGGVAVFPKGRSWQSERDVALANWTATIETVPSTTTPDSVVLRIEGIAHV